jgi:predicted ATPase
VLTGGPGAGKTAVLNIARQRYCRHVRVLEEAASIVFGGGFPRGASLVGRKGAQRAIYHVQIELQAIAGEPGPTCVALCDRGTLDGLAYWPEGPESFFHELGTTHSAELLKYAAIIHLRTPSPAHYGSLNPLRVESPAEARAIDERILEVWDSHPNRVVIESTDDFFDKARRALAVVEAELPECCRQPSALELPS